LASQKEPPGSATLGTFGCLAGAGVCFGISLEIADHTQRKLEAGGDGFASMADLQNPFYFRGHTVFFTLFK
jgi:hypothetical protein